MSNKIFTISSRLNSTFRLKTIDDNDLENLRLWKNHHKSSFFLKTDITSIQQLAWFENFKKRKDDFMLIVEEKREGNWEAIGCMGFRYLPDESCIDAYNIMRGKKLETTFTMSDAFGLMLAYVASEYETLPIRCKVLCDNPAVDWYKKNHFSVIGQIDDYYLMELNKDSVTKIEFIKNKII